MWIGKIKLDNFKSYGQAEFTFPQPETGKNIVLVGAENGHGKTTLLEAIYLCLYGEEAAAQLRRAGIPLEKSGYDMLLKDALHHKAAQDTYSLKMAVEMDIYKLSPGGAVTGLRITRSWSYDRWTKNRIPTDDVCNMWRLKDDGNLLIEKVEQKEALKEYALPFSYAPFFFFDGEKIVDNARDAGAGKWLRDGLEGLSGVTLLTDVEHDLSQYVATCFKTVNEKDRLDFERLEKELANEVKTYETLQTELSALAQQKTELEELEDRLQNQLGGGSDAKSTEQIRADISAAKDAIKTAETHLEQGLKALPLALLPTKLTENLQLTLEKEANLLRYQASKEQGESKMDDFIQAFSNNESALKACGELTLKSPQMRTAIQEAWHKLWYPLPDSCAQKIEHNYLTLQSHDNVQSVISELAAPQIDWASLCLEIEHNELKKNDLERQLAHLAGSNNDELLSELRKTSSAVRDVAMQHKAKEQNLTACEMRVSNKEDDLERTRIKILESEPNQIKGGRAEQTKQLLVQLKTQLIAKKLDELSLVVTEIHQNLAHDERIGRILIKPTGDFELYGTNQALISSSLSAGQMQILIMALVSALAQITYCAAPFVIDTPLARLDSSHRQGLFKHWCGLPQQVILLSQDTEITFEVKEQLHGHIQKTYLVKADSLDTGGASSRIIENAYFTH